MRNLRRVIITIAAVLVLAPGTVSAGMSGAPQPWAEDGNFSLGGGYFHTVDQWELAEDADDRDVTQNQIYLQFSVNSRNSEFYARVGGADLKIDEAFAAGSADTEFSDDYQRFGTIGAKCFFDINTYWGIGIFAQGSMFSKYTDSTTELVGGISTTHECSVSDYYTVDIGLTLQGKFKNLILYAGPYYYWTRADGEASNTHLGFTSSSDINIKQDRCGGIAGIRIPLVRGLNIELEGQYQQDFSAGGAINYAF